MVDTTSSIRRIVHETLLRLQEKYKPNLAGVALQKHQAAEIAKPPAQWDIALLCRVLVKTKVLNAVQKKAVDRVWLWRNEYAHAKVGEHGMDAKTLATLRQCLVELDGDVTGFDTALQMRSAPCWPSHEQAPAEHIKNANALLSESYRALQRGDTDTALQQVGKAIELSALVSPELCALLYLQRAKVHATSGELERALSNVESALQSNTKLGQAWLLKAELLIKANRPSEPALKDSLERARELRSSLTSKQQEWVQKELNKLRDVAGRDQRLEHLDPSYLPSFSHHVGLQEASIRQQLSVEQLQELLRTPGLLPSDSQCLVKAKIASARGDTREACLNYSAAGALGNAEGMYNLGVLLYKQQDFSAAIAQFMKASQCERLNPATLEPVIGVGEALHSLALHSYDGVGVTRSVNKALEYWYEAVDLGCADAENSLAVAIAGDNHVSVARALDLYKAAALQGISRAMYNIADVYLQLFRRDVPVNLELAKLWAKSSSARGLSAGDTLLQDLIEAEQCSPQIIPRKFQALLQNLQPRCSSPSSVAHPTLDPTELFAQASRGVKFASYLFSLLVKLDPTQVPDLDKFAKFLEQPDSELLLHFFRWTPALFETAERRWIAESSRSAAVVRSVQLLLNDEYSSLDSLLDSALHRFPRDPFFLRMKGCALSYGPTPDREKASQFFRAALERLPSDGCVERASTLYLLAVSLNLAGANDSAGPFFEQFIDCALTGHRKIPEAFFRLGIIALASEKRDTTRARKMLLRGQQLQPSCFLSYANSTVENWLCLGLGVTPSTSERQDDSKEGVDMSVATHRLKKFTRAVHRSQFNLQKFQQLPAQLSTTLTVKPAEERQAEKDGSSISIEEMQARYVDCAYKKYVLDCMVVSPWNKMTSYQLVVRDERGDPLPASFYNLADEDAKLLVPGRQLQLISPHFRLASDGTTMLRLESKANVKFGELSKVCWYCFRRIDARLQCGRCKKACYCSSKCQKADWHDREHKRACAQ